MVNSMFVISEYSRGSNNTVFNNVTVNNISNPPIVSEIYNFSIKITFITQLINKILYNDTAIPLIALQQEYNIIRYELNIFKQLLIEEYNTRSLTYQIVISNILNTFIKLHEELTIYVNNLTLNNLVYITLIDKHVELLSSNINLLKQEDIPYTPIAQSNISLQKILFDLYQNIGKDIEYLLNLFSLGKYDELQEGLTYEMYVNLAQQLLKEEHYESIEYMNIYNVLHSSLEGLYKSALLNETHKQQINDLQSEIELLKEGGGDGLFSSTATVDTVALVRPEIMEYIRLYGFPEGVVFDTIKLTEIINRLNIEI